MKRLTISLVLLVILLTACSARVEYVVTTKVYSSGNPAPPLPQPMKVVGNGDTITASGVGKGVSDPFNLREGVYRLTLTTDQSFTAVSVDRVSGDSCTGIASSGKISGEVTVSGEVKSSGCRAVINADPANGAWQIVLTRLQ